MDPPPWWSWLLGFLLAALLLFAQQAPDRAP